MTRFRIADRQAIAPVLRGPARFTDRRCDIGSWFVAGDIGQFQTLELFAF